MLCNHCFYRQLQPLVNAQFLQVLRQTVLFQEQLDLSLDHIKLDPWIPWGLVMHDDTGMLAWRIILHRNVSMSHLSCWACSILRSMQQLDYELLRRIKDITCSTYSKCHTFPCIYGTICCRMRVDSPLARKIIWCREFTAVSLSWNCSEYHQCTAHRTLHVTRPPPHLLQFTWVGWIAKGVVEAHGNQNYNQNYN